MFFLKNGLVVTLLLLLTACLRKGPNPIDPYESFNRKSYQFNMAFDATFLKQPARLYNRVVPTPIRQRITNAYANLDLIPTVVNDVLQADFRHTIKDSWRLLINSTLGVAGFIDVASTFGLPPHSNDLGLTFAKWGDKKSPYLMIPILGPSTVRDGAGMIFQYPLLTPFSYVAEPFILYSASGVKYLDIRSRLFETEKLLHEALDPYILMRDAFLQHRQYLITGEVQSISVDASLYVDE